jgi:hypothetical protein
MEKKTCAQASGAPRTRVSYSRRGRNDGDREEIERQVRRIEEIGERCEKARHFEATRRRQEGGARQTHVEA